MCPHPRARIREQQPWGGLEPRGWKERGRVTCLAVDGLLCRVGWDKVVGTAWP